MVLSFKYKSVSGMLMVGYELNGSSYVFEGHWFQEILDSNSSMIRNMFFLFVSVNKTTIIVHSFCQNCITELNQRENAFVENY